MTDLEISSRTEKIKLAREHCNRGLNDFSYPSSRMKSSYETLPITEMSISKVKLFFIRFIIAALLFASIYSIKHFNITYKNYSYQTIKEAISSSSHLDQMQSTIADYFSNKVIPVFHRPTE